MPGKTLECWDTINTEDIPNVNDAPKLIFTVEAQGKNTDIIVSFMDMVENGKLRLLEKRLDADYDLTDTEFIERHIAPFLQTDAFLEEVSNLKVKNLSKNNITIEKVIASLDKDRFSACAYGLYYIKYNLSEKADGSDYDFVFIYD
jgi:ribonucleoside-diphosphate reductase alpha chain